jgi:surface-anchored protein
MRNHCRTKRPQKQLTGNMKKTILQTAIAALAALAIHSPSLQAQDINFTGGGADLTFYFESTGPGTGNWYSVFRAKGTAGQPTTAVATNLTSPFTGFTGIAGNQVPTVAGNTGDYNFSSLTVTATTAGSVVIGSTTFYTLTASGSPFNPATPTADLGIRTRFQSQSTNQFPDGMRLTLDLAGSSFNGDPLLTSGAYVSLLNWSGSDPVALINTDGGSSFADFSMSGHVHRNWGFSQEGNYQLVFTMTGLGGTGDYAGVPAGSTTVNFQVVPEPSTGLLLLGGLGLAALLRRRMQKKC